MSANLPARFESVEVVEDFMTAPSAELMADLAATPGDIMVLGVGGKMGPTLARMAKRAAPTKRVMGVARFSEPGVREALEIRLTENPRSVAASSSGMMRGCIVGSPPVN